jgi:hypothetical protein
MLSAHTGMQLYMRRKRQRRETHNMHIGEQYRWDKVQLTTLRNNSDAFNK